MVRHQNSPQWDDNLLELLDYDVMYRQRAKSVL